MKNSVATWRPGWSRLRELIYAAFEGSTLRNSVAGLYFHDEKAVEPLTMLSGKLYGAERAGKRYA